jgi:hypothetical protein
MSQTESTTARLSDAQLVILSAAAQRADGSLLPFPQGLSAKGASLSKAIETLSRRKLVMEKRVIKGEAEWRRDQEGRPLGLFIANGGLLALGLEESENEASLSVAANSQRHDLAAELGKPLLPAQRSEEHMPKPNRIW